MGTGTWSAGTLFDVEWREDGVYKQTTTGVHSYTPAAPGTVVTATLMAYKPGYTTASIRLVARKGTATFTPSPLIGATVGDTFSVSSPGFTFPMATPEATYYYLWYSNNVLIKNLKTPTYVASSAFLGKNLSVRITMVSPLYNTLVGTFPATLVTAHPAAIGAPDLTSTSPPKPGVKLSVVPGTYSTTGLAFTYAIQRSTNGGTTWTTVTSASSYTLAAGDAGALFRAIVTAKKAGWVNSVEYTSDVAIGWLGPLDTVGPLTINGTGAVGSPLSVAPVWNTTSVVVTYRWLRNGVTIPGVTGTTYTPLASNFGDEIDVVINASKAGYQPVVITSNTVKVGQVLAPAPVSTPLTHSPAVARQGTPVTVYSAWNVDGLTLTYEWVDIADPLNVLSTSQTFIPPMIANYRVTIKANKPGYQEGTATRIVVAQP